MLASLLLIAHTAGAGGPDLVVDKLTIEPSEPTIGHQVEVKAVIKNVGDDDVADFLCIGGDIKIRFLYDGVPFADEQLSCGLDPDETDGESAKVPIATGGPHTVTVWIDPDDDIEELDEENNQATLEFEAGEPGILVSHSLPAIGAPGLEDVIATVTVTNETVSKVKDVFVFLEIVDKVPQMDFGLTQGSNLSPQESHTWETEVSYGLDVSYGAFEPGDYTWRFRVFQNGLPPDPDAVALTELETAPLKIVPTVEVDQDNVVVPVVDPVAVSTGSSDTVTAWEVLYGKELYTVALGFAVPVDFLSASSWTVLSQVHALEVLDADGLQVCDPEIRRRTAQALLLWRDLVVEHPWYKGSYVAIQQSYDWYYDEKHLKVVYYITQPFVIVKELLQDMVSAGKDLTEWVSEKVGLSTPEESEVGTLTFKVTMVITKSFDTAGAAAQQIVKLSPLLAGQAYLSDHVIAERLLKAIEDGGSDFDHAVDMIHELIKEDSPDRYEKITQVLPPALILGSIASTLAEGIKEVLWTGIKRGFTAYFISKLTAKTAWKVAIGEGSATLAAGLTTAGIAKGIASLGLTLIIDASIAYLTYVGTFIDNIRGPGGLIEAGQIVAQSIPWTHVLYELDGTSDPLDADVVEDTFLAHAVLYEIYGFILSDLAMLKKLAFAKAQSAEYLEDSLAMFEVSKSQRTFAVSLQTVTTLLAASPCVEGPPGEPDGNPVSHEPVPVEGDEDEPEPEPEEPRASTWDKPRAYPLPDERGTHPPVRWLEHSDEPVAPPEPPPPPPVVETGCSATSSGAPGGAVALIGLLLTLGLLRRRRLGGAILVVAAVLALGCADTGVQDGTPDPTTDTTAATGEPGADTATTGDDPGTGSTGADTDTGPATGSDPGTDDTGVDTTGGDECPGGCDDGNPCTKDACKSGECQSQPLSVPDCAPLTTITSPLRGSTLFHPGGLTVTGTLSSPIGEVLDLQFNGTTLPVSPTATSFEVEVPELDHGINIITATMTDPVGQSTAVHSALASETFYDTVDGVTGDALVNNGLVVWLGKELWDDNDLDDIDDVATAVHLVLQGLDLMTVIPSPLTGEGEEPGFGWCEWTVTVTEVSYVVYNIDVAPQPGGLFISGSVTDLVLGFDAKSPGFACPDAVGVAYAPTATLAAFVTIELEEDGTVLVSVPEGDVDVVLGPLEFDITGGIVSGLDWVLNWFGSQVAGWVEQGVENVLIQEVGPLVGGIVEKFSTFVHSFEIPPFLGGTETVPVTVAVQGSYLDLTEAGAVVGLSLSATTPKGVSGLESPGSLARNGCFSDIEQPLSIPKDAHVALAVHDDLFNQGIFAAWWGGILHKTVDAELIATLLPDLPVEGFTVSVAPLLPPVLTSCTANGKTQLQVGDVNVQADFLFNDEPASLEAFVSAAFEIEIEVAAVEGATIDLEFGVTDLVALDFEVVKADGSVAGAQNLLQLILTNVVEDVLVEMLSAGIFQNFPVPSFDLGTVVPGLPIGTVLSFDPNELIRLEGYVMLNGTVVD